MKKIGLTLGGGGARGICHIEFLKILDEMNLKPSIISGTSIGAIIGAFYASGLSGKEINDILDTIDISNKRPAEVAHLSNKEGNKLEKFVDEVVIDLKEYYRKLENIHKIIDISFFKNSSFLHGKRIEKFFEENLPVRTFEELKIPLRIVATDYWEQKQVVFNSGDLIPAIRASMSIPAVFEPVILDDMVLIDGGITNNLPYDIIQDECDITIAIDVSGNLSIPEKIKVPNLFENIMNSFEILQDSVIKYQMKIKTPDIYIKPELKDVGILDFHKAYEILGSVKYDVRILKEELISHLSKKTGLRDIRDNIKGKIKNR
ncbi:MAG: patatin-like phospholipase family protein [Candidatus Tenebribacter burtonii]|jgi:NTE family protein|nr:patatin-like phospholipase family protein [Candidatus Tenebribacter burtonii]